MTDVAFITTRSNGSCGIGRYTSNLVAELETEIETSCIYLNHTGVKNIIASISLVRTAIGCEADIIHVQHEYELFRGSPLNLPGFHTFTVYGLLFPYILITGTKLLTTMHTVYSIADNGRPLRATVYLTILHNFILIMSDRVVALSENSYDRLTNCEHNTQCIFIPHGVNTTSIKMDVRSAKHALGYDSDDTIISLPGYIEQRKGHDMFLEIAADLPQYQFLIAGGASSEDSETYRDQLEAKASENVRFSGVLPESKFETVFEASDIVILPYKKINQSGILNRCVAHRVPVVASSLPYFEQLAEDDIVRTCNGATDKFRTQINKLISDEALQERMTQAMKMYESNNSIKKASENHIRLYGDIR